MAFPPAVERGAIRGYFLYDVADTIDLSITPQILGESVSRAPLQLRPEAAGEFIQFTVPPVAVRRSPTILAKIFDYGVISLRVSTPFAGSWVEFAETSRRLRRDEALVAEAHAELQRLLSDLRPILQQPHAPLFEDYFVFEVERFADRITAKDLLDAHASELARLVVCEDRPLASREQEDVFRVSFSYYEDDLVVVGWENAFVFDATPAPVEDILEFANTQLVELRTYDARLDAELDRIYKSKPLRPVQRLLGRGSSAWAQQLRFLIVDIRELLDRSANALKFIGDAYFARLYRGTATRLGLDEWQRQIDAKLDSVSEMYRFTQDRAEHARDNLLEVIIIILIVVEVAIGIVALRHG